MDAMTFAFDTDRLRVFDETVTSWSEDGVTRTPTDGEPRRKFVAYLKTETTYTEAAHAIVWDQRKKEHPILFRLYCEWIEVPGTLQRNGYAQELYKGIEKAMGGEEMEAEAVTEAGERLLRKMNRVTSSLVRQLKECQQNHQAVLTTAQFQGNQTMIAYCAGILSILNSVNMSVQDRLRAAAELSRRVEEQIKAKT